MKRLSVLLFIAVFLFSLCSCGGSGEVTFKDNIDIPQNGIIKASVLAEIKEQNAAVKFCGESAGLKYEWTLFGKNISRIKDINIKLSLDIPEEKSLKIGFESKENIDIPMTLSVFLKEKWDNGEAFVYRNEEYICTASITGTDASIINLSLKDTVGEITVCEKSPDFSDSSGISKDAETVKSDKTDSDKHISDGEQTSKDKYNTDPVPEGKPLPVEPESSEKNSQNRYTCTFSIECTTVLNNLDKLDKEKLDVIPNDGFVLKKITAEFTQGESVFDVLKRTCRENGIHLEFSFTPMYNSAFIEGIDNIYQNDCGDLSGWMYRVNGRYPAYGPSRYLLSDGDNVEWRYTCDLGADIGNASSEVYK